MGSKPAVKTARKNASRRSFWGEFARRLASGALIATFVLSAPIPFAGVDAAWAQSESEKKPAKKPAKKRARRQSYVVSPVVFKKLSAIQELMADGQYAEAMPLLEQAANRKKLSDHEESLINELYGFAYNGQGEYAKATVYFEKCLVLEALPNTTLTTMRYNLAQLYMALEEFQKAIDHLVIWMGLVENPGAGAYYMIGAAHAQLLQAKQALPYIAKAVERSKKFNESWYQLLLALHFELKQYKEAVGVLAVLIEHEPKKAYLQQLQGVYAELGSEKKALAVMELSYRQGYLDSDNELRNLSYLYLYHEIPNLAAQVMMKGLSDGTIEADSDAWELLGDCWLHAREYERAIEPLTKAAEMAEDGEIYVKLSRVYLEQQNWEEARKALGSALKKGDLDNPGDAQLMLGISNANVDRYDAARKAFEQAAKADNTRSSATTWLEHLERLETEAERKRQSS